MQKTFIKQFFQLAIGTMINLIIGVLTTPIITRLVNPSEYGQLSLFNTYSSIIMMICCLGLDQSLIRYYYSDNSKEYKISIFKMCFKIPFIVTLIGSIIIVVLKCMDLKLFYFDNAIIYLLIINIFVLLINRFGMLLLRLQYKTGFYSLLNILHKTLYVLIVIPLVLIINNYYLYILIFATVISTLLSALVSIVIESAYWKELQSKKTIFVSKVELIKFGFPLMIASGVFLLFQATDKICIKYFGTYTDVGVYSSAQSLMAIFSIIQSTFNTLWAPKAIDYYENNSEYRTFYSDVNQIITVLMFSFGAFVLLFKDMFVLLLGEEYREAATIIPFLIFNPIMYTISETTVTGLTIAKKSECQVLITIISCCINIIGNFVFIPIFGIKGAAISTGISYIVFFSLRTAFSMYYFPVNFKLSKFYVLTVIFLLNSYINMYHSFDIYVISMFLFTMFSIIILYHSIIIEYLKIGNKILSYKYKKLKENF